MNVRTGIATISEIAMRWMYQGSGDGPARVTKARVPCSLTHEDDEDGADTEPKVISAVVEGTCVRCGVRRRVRDGRVVHRGGAGEGVSEGGTRVEVWVAWMVSPRATSRGCNVRVAISKRWDGGGRDGLGWVL